MECSKPPQPWAQSLQVAHNSGKILLYNGDYFLMMMMMMRRRRRIV